MVQHILHFVDPATLMSGAGENLTQSFPEAHGTVTDRNLRGAGQAAALEAHQQLAPTLRTLAQTNLEAQQFLFAFRRCSDDHQHTFCVVFHAGLKINTVGPDIDIAAGRKIASLPTFILRLAIQL